MASPPVFSSARTVSCPSTSATATLAPASTISRAVSAPIPRAAPEINATLPSSRFIASPRHSVSGTFVSSSSSQTLAVASEGARQSPRGDSEPPDEILGPLGRAERLNWLSSKKRYRNTRSHRLISGRVYARLAPSEIFSGQCPRIGSLQAFHER